MFRKVFTARWKFYAWGGVGEGIGGGEKPCASPSGNARLGALPLIDNSSEADVTGPIRPREFTAQETWFTEWWQHYWLHRAKKTAREAFLKHVKSEERFQQVMVATRAQRPEMLSREPGKRPHGATWLNGARWEDEVVSLAKSDCFDAAAALGGDE